MSSSSIDSFAQLPLSQEVLDALDSVGYEQPSPIQAQCIPLIAEGLDLLGQAQTGTGKTAAFALPLLSRLELKQQHPQVMVLTPTRELAIQVAEAFQKYAQRLKGFHVLPIYGGQDYRVQIRALKRGVHVVVGTPGRVMDHMRRGTLKLGGLRTLVLDEADEMLRMGFIEDVEWILEQLPEQRQIALFSATLPAQIRKIADRYLHDPAQISIKARTTTAETIRQRLWMVRKVHKLDALTRILEAEPFDAMIVFVRTRTATVELADKLQARGYGAAPLNGEIAQQQRERTVAQLKSGKLDILVATDVAARGLDVERISHVINYDIPTDTEAYVHRIGRTGRAGRQGDAILFVAPRERRLLRAIEKTAGHSIEVMSLPSASEVNERRITRFKQRIDDTLKNQDLDFFSRLVQEYAQEQTVPLEQVAAALAYLTQGDSPLLLSTRQDEPSGEQGEQRGKKHATGKQNRATGHRPEEGMERFRIAVGYQHQVSPGQIVAVLANEAGIDGEYIGRIDIHETFSLVDLPTGMPKELFNALKRVHIAGEKLNIARDKGSDKRSAKARSGQGARARAGGRPGAGKPHRKKPNRSTRKHAPAKGGKPKRS